MQVRVLPEAPCYLNLYSDCHRDKSLKGHDDDGHLGIADTRTECRLQTPLHVPFKPLVGAGCDQCRLSQSRHCRRGMGGGLPIPFNRDQSAKSAGVERLCACRRGLLSDSALDSVARSVLLPILRPAVHVTRIDVRSCHPKVSRRPNRLGKHLAGLRRLQSQEVQSYAELFRPTWLG